VRPAISVLTPSSMKSRFSSSTTTTTAGRPHHHYRHRIPSASSREAEAKMIQCVSMLAIWDAFTWWQSRLTYRAAAWGLDIVGREGNRYTRGSGTWRNTEAESHASERRVDSSDALGCDVLCRFQLLRLPSCPPPPIHDPRFT
jgi:hypothetical protein